MAQINWCYDELVLAAELLLQNNWKAIRKSDPRARALSELLREGRLHAGAVLPPSFRSSSSIQRKTYDMLTADPEYHGKPTRGGKLEEIVLSQFKTDPEGMQSLASGIRAALRAGETLPEDESANAVGADEGTIIEYVTKKRERDPKLRAAKIKQAESSGGSIACESCGFDFEVTYGSRGSGYIEVHHVTPLYVSGKTLTTLEDLALLCANCHRMCHRSPWVKPADLKLLLEQ